MTSTTTGGRRGTLNMRQAAFIGVGALVAFTFTTLVDEPATAAALVVILVASVVLDLVWKRARGTARPTDVRPGVA